MNPSAIPYEPVARDVTVTDDLLQVVLADGREVKTPFVWFPRLQAASAGQRNNWQLIGGGIGVHWPEVDEDISVESLLRIV